MSTNCTVFKDCDPETTFKLDIDVESQGHIQVLAMKNAKAHESSILLTEAVPTFGLSCVFTLPPKTRAICIKPAKGNNLVTAIAGMRLSAQ